MSTPKDRNSLENVPAYAAMRRAKLRDYMNDVGAGPGQPDGLVGQVLAQDPQEMNSRVLKIAQIALDLLPVGTLSPTQKAVYGRQINPALFNLLAHIVDAMHMASSMGVSFRVRPERLMELFKQQGAYASFKLLGMQMTNSGMDQRVVAGSFLAYLIDQTLAVLQRRLGDDKLSQKERDRMIDDFAAALLRLDEVLKYPVERKEEVAAIRNDKAEQLKEAQADAQLEETKLKLRQKLVVPRKELFAAALRHKQLEEKNAPKGGHGRPPTSSPRRIV